MPIDKVPKKRKEDREIFQSSFQFLTSLAKLMCADSAEITIVQCGAGEGSEGELLRSELQRILGPKVTVRLFSGICGYSFGVPTAFGGEKTTSNPK